MQAALGFLVEFGCSSRCWKVEAPSLRSATKAVFRGVDGSIVDSGTS